MGCICSNSTPRSSQKSKPELRKEGNFAYFLFGKIYSEDKYVGQGCRMAFAWSTSSTKQQVRFNIEEFWENRRHGNPDAWRTLRLAIDTANDDEARAIVTTAGLTMPNGRLNGCVDDRGFVYELPPYVLNPALEYGTATETFATGKGEVVNLKFRSTHFDDVDIKISTLDLVQTVKANIAERVQLNPPQVRLFYNGREMKNELALLQYGVKDNTTITVVTLPKT